MILGRMLCRRLPIFKLPAVGTRLVSDEEHFSKLSHKSGDHSGKSPPKQLSHLHNLGPCVELIKKHDYEHYLCVLISPILARRGLSALRAFNVELSKAAVTPYSSATEREVSKLKLLWWKQVIEAKDGDVFAGSPIASELKSTIEQRKLSKGFLFKLIDARMKPQTFNSLLDVERAADETYSVMNYLTMEVFKNTSVDSDHAASHLGRCEGHIALIRSIPLLASRGACLVPNTTLAKFEISQADIIRGKHPEKVKDVVHEIASSAHVHAEHCENLMKTLPLSAKFGLLPLIPARIFLKRLKKYDFDIFHERVLLRTPFLFFKLVYESKKLNFHANVASMKKLVLKVKKQKK